MNDIEREVREMLRTKVADAPVREEPPPVVLRRTKTLRAVNGVGIMAAAAAIVLGVVLGAQTFGDRTVEPDGPSDPVPWVSDPAVTVAPPLEVTAKRPCAAGDLVVKGMVDEALKPSGLSFSPRGRGVFCVVDPHVGFTVTLYGPDARPLPVEVRVGRAADPFDVDSRQPSVTRSLDLRWANYCGPQVESVSVNIALETSLLSTSEVWNDLPACNDAAKPSILEFTGTSADVVDDNLGPLPTTTDPLLVAVQPVVEGPAQARRGESVRFAVTLVNGSESDVPLDPCPNYSEGFRTSLEANFAGSYRLNCAGVPSNVLPAEGRITFEMKVTVPRSLRPGTWMLFWHFKPDGVVGETPIRIL